jgi:hypothetical protein
LVKSVSPIKSTWLSRFHLLLFLGPIGGSIEGVESSFHVLRSRIHFRQYRGRRLRFSCFALANPLSAISRAPSPVDMYCTPGPIFDGAVSSFHVFFLLDTFPTVPRALGPVFMFCVPGPVFGDNEGIGSSFHVLCYRTHFRWYRGHRVLFSYFALSYPFSTYRAHWV